MYAEIEVHRTMICDRVRTEAFRRAIDATVRPGDVVLDVGAGSGILSMFAAQAGASRVYAVERTTVAVMAQELIAANGFADVIRVIQGDMMDIELPEQRRRDRLGVARRVRDRRGHAASRDCGP